MGGRDNRKLVSFRANDQELAVIEKLVKDSGLSKQEYLLKAALGAIAHTPLVNADSSIKSASVKDSRLLSADDSSSLQFEAEQVIDGQQNKTYKMLWASFEASQKLGKFEYQLSNKLGVLCQVKPDRSRSGKKKLRVVATFPGDRVVINDDGTFLFYVGEGEFDFLLESSLAMQGATAPEEAINIGTLAKANEMPSSPLNEPVAEAIEEAPTEPLTITKKEFKALYQLDDETFSKLGNKLKTGVTTPDGKTWFKLSQSRVTTANPQVSSTQLTLALV